MLGLRVSLILNRPNLYCHGHQLLNLLLYLCLTQRWVEHRHLLDQFHGRIGMLFVKRMVVNPLRLLKSMNLLFLLLNSIWLHILIIVFKLVKIKLVIHQLESVNTLRWDYLLLDYLLWINNFILFWSRIACINWRDLSLNFSFMCLRLSLCSIWFWWK